MLTLVIGGNPKPKSQTRRIAELLVGRMFSAVEHQVETIDMADCDDDVAVRHES